MQSANWGWGAFDRDRNKPIISAAAAGIFDACPIIDITFDAGHCAAWAKRELAYTT
jgi:hypothetical protein